MKFQFDPLPKGFVLAKPIQYGEYDANEIYELERNDRLIIEVKRDGWKIFLIKLNNAWKAYTDGSRDITDRLPQDVIDDLYSKEIPDKTLFVSEFVYEEHEEVAPRTDDPLQIPILMIKDNRSKVISQLNSHKAPKIEQTENSFFALYVFDVLFWHGKPVINSPYHERFGIIWESIRDGLCVRPINVLNQHALKMIYPKFGYFDAAKQTVLETGHEGLVLYDKEFRSSFRLDGGNPKRPDGCYKWKPMYEGDFIVRNLVPSKKSSEDFKEILLLQIDHKTGKEIDCGKHGVFSKKDREEIQSLFRKNKPFVVQFEYEARTINHKLINKRFVGIRYDKKWQDCIMPAKIFPKNMK